MTGVALVFQEGVRQAAWLEGKFTGRFHVRPLCGNRIEPRGNDSYFIGSQSRKKSLHLRSNRQSYRAFYRGSLRN